MGRVGKFGKSLVNKAKSAYGKVTGKRSLNQYKVSPVQDVHGIDNDVLNRNHQMRAKASALSGLSKAGKTTGGALRNLPQKALGAARGVRHHIKKTGQFVGGMGSRKNVSTDNNTGVAYGKRTGSLSKPQKPPRNSNSSRNLTPESKFRGNLDKLAASQPSVSYKDVKKNLKKRARVQMDTLRRGGGGGGMDPTLMYMMMQSKQDADAAEEERKQARKQAAEDKAVETRQNFFG